jgi:hypothetical protein
VRKILSSIPFLICLGKKKKSSKISIKQIIDLLSMQLEGHKYLHFLDVDQEIMYALRGRWLRRKEMVVL